jgi:uncharacterized protein (TIGR00251 family)
MDWWIMGGRRAVNPSIQKTAKPNHSSTAATAASFLRETAGGTLVAVKLQPRASKNEIGEPLGDELKIKVTAPPVDSAANEALVKFLAETLGCPRGKVELIRGQTSRHKTILLHGFTPEEIQRKLDAAK